MADVVGVSVELAACVGQPRELKAHTASVATAAAAAAAAAAAVRAFPEEPEPLH